MSQDLSKAKYKIVQSYSNEYSIFEWSDTEWYETQCGFKTLIEAEKMMMRYVSLITHIYDKNGKKI